MSPSLQGIGTPMPQRRLRREPGGGRLGLAAQAAPMGREPFPQGCH
ncbi:hypothetical protein BSIN_0710 [Burkholderia singularis]|uniref:Uncharacterized protein n=1 Tax=Burkholderia singularis TaxID=1503053 RepID=A0A238H8M3_9BURK|nr:hypothetical protein BSIN_0710 [Burkholderia singularis]